MRFILLMGLTLFLTGTMLSAQDRRGVEKAQGLQPGIMAPLFTAMDADSIEYSLGDELSKGPVVVIFYRGHWCPHCNKHLQRVQDSLHLIYATGASVVAISPQKPEYLDLMKQKTGAAFSLLYDEDYTISEAYDVTFTPEARQLFTYNKILMANLKKSQSDDTQRLPVPATYIIDTNGIIAWRQFDPDYKKRSTIEAILKALSHLN